MLTNIFYFNFYRPYIFRTVSASDGTTHSLVKFAEKRLVIPQPTEDGTAPTFLLNKSMTNDVIDYLRNVASSVVGTKHYANNVANDMINFNKYSEKFDNQTAKRWIGESIQHFTDYYNNSVEFMSTQLHSKSLKEFSFELSQFVGDNLKDFSLIGLYMSGGKLNFNSKYYENMSQGELRKVIGSTSGLFKNIYERAIDVLAQPLTEHMKFKNLSYYYNYKLGTIVSDTFKIIEAGMIVDEVV